MRLAAAIMAHFSPAVVAAVGGNPLKLRRTLKTREDFGDMGTGCQVIILDSRLNIVFESAGRGSPGMGAWEIGSWLSTLEAVVF